MQETWQSIIEQSIGKILDIRTMSGGDTSSVYYFKSSSHELIAKVNIDALTPTLLQAEYLGLQALTQTRTIATPHIHLYHQDAKWELLVLEYVPLGPAHQNIMADFGVQLAHLHLSTQSTFGWTQDNYIGRLPQSNESNENWVSFYLTERLLPQIRLAVNKRLLHIGNTPSEDHLETVCQQLLGAPPPSALHGDLWNGNYLSSTNGKVYLIDPSFYFGHAEVDLAMSRLFGGFHAAFYEGYHEVLPQAAGFMERQDIYQLYYLLVHLNMFGRSYLSSVDRILQRYFS